MMLYFFWATYHQGGIASVWGEDDASPAFGEDLGCGAGSIKHLSFALVLLLLEVVLLASALLSRFPFGLAGVSLPALSVCPPAETSSANRTTKSESEGISRSSLCLLSGLQAANPILDGTCPFGINQPECVH